MRLQEIIGIIKEYFLLALVAVIILGIIFILGYFIVYRKLLGGKKSLPKKRIILWGLFIGYIIMVIGVTFLNRGPSYQGGISLSFFSSYREAWYSFSTRHWQFIYLNIFMFVPFGILFPLLHPHFKRWFWTIGIAACFTLSIESVQLITGYGNFVVDDLFNNLLGAIIGYGIVMGFITLREKGLKRFAFYLSPLLLVIILSLGIFAYYNSKEFGNLSIMPDHRTNMANATVTMDAKFDDTRRTVPIYKAPSYSKASANKFVTEFFKRLNLDTFDMEIISYQSEGVYWVRDERSHNIWFRNLDGSYTYNDFSSFDQDKTPKDVDEETLRESLMKMDISIPEDIQYQRKETGTYEWRVDQKVMESQLINGTLTATYYNDGIVKRIDNRLITYDKVKDIQIKSEQEAYNQILKGRFQNYSKTIKTLHIHKVEISYYLDSKGYFQPVYAFHSRVDGTDRIIYIPGI